MHGCQFPQLTPVMMIERGPPPPDKLGSLVQLTLGYDRRQSVHPQLLFHAVPAPCRPRTMPPHRYAIPSPRLPITLPSHPRGGLSRCCPVTMQSHYIQSYPTPSRWHSCFLACKLVHSIKVGRVTPSRGPILAFDRGCLGDLAEVVAWRSICS